MKSLKVICRSRLTFQAILFWRIVGNNQKNNHNFAFGYLTDSSKSPYNHEAKTNFLLITPLSALQNPVFMDIALRKGSLRFQSSFMRFMFPTSFNLKYGILLGYSPTNSDGFGISNVLLST